MNKASFTIQKSIIAEAIKGFTKILGKATRYNKNIILELTVTDNFLTLVTPGIKLHLPCKTISTAKATINFWCFKDVIQNFNLIEIPCIIYSDFIQISSLSIKCQTTFFETDAILRSIELPINYEDLHLLQLEHRGYTSNEIEFNGLESELALAKNNYKKNLSKAFEILTMYNISKIEIDEMMQAKINIKSISKIQK